VLSFSNVIALIALFVALGGSVYAASNKISGTQIKPKSLPGNRIKARSLTGAQIKARTLTGAKIKPGSLTGKQVVGSSLKGVTASSLGAVGYAVTNIVLAREVARGTSTTADCPAGQTVIGGGAVVSDDLAATVNDSGPLASRTGWEATAYSWREGATMTVTAICTTVSSSAGTNRQERDQTQPRPPIYLRR
jgi:hypothetical protein